MAKFRRKPVIVEAVQFSPDLPKDQWPPGVEEREGHWKGGEYCN